MNDWFHELIHYCWVALAAALALYLAVHLIESVWLALLVIACIGTAIGGSVVVLRRRHQGW